MDVKVRFKRTRENESGMMTMISIIYMVLSLRFCLVCLVPGLSLYTPGKISQGSKLPFSIEFSEDALDKESVEYQTLCNGMKKVLGIVVGLLKDRACAEEEPERKRVRIEGYRSKK